MRSLPPLTALRAFEAAARRRSFKEASAELGVTPTAVSHQIRELERHCGLALFRRRPLPLTLTEAGAALFPAVHDAFAAVADRLAALRAEEAAARLRVTATNAFAARWLLPRLPALRKSQPRLRLDVIGTDAVLDVAAGEADAAIRYSRSPPADIESVLLARDSFHVVASPTLVAGLALPLAPSAIARLPLIACGWLPSDTEAPTWARWEAEVRRRDGAAPPLAHQVLLSFQEELHAIEAAIGGQGAAICSDVLVGAELASGRLLRLSEISLPGYGFHFAWRAKAPRHEETMAFLEWLRAMLRPGAEDLGARLTRAAGRRAATPPACAEGRR